MRERRLKDTDSTELVNRLRALVWLGPPALFLLSLLEFVTVGASWKLVVLMVLNFPLVLLIVVAILYGSDLSARGWVRMVSGAGNIVPNPSYSSQESLIIRGQFAEAAESFRNHLIASPGDHDARLALAALCSRHLADPENAERLYLEVRQGKPTARQEGAVGNYLIDLYQATGQRGRLMVELARYAERYAGTKAAAGAKRMLAELKSEEPRK